MQSLQEWVRVPVCSNMRICVVGQDVRTNFESEVRIDNIYYFMTGVHLQMDQSLPHVKINPAHNLRDHSRTEPENFPAGICGAERTNGDTDAFAPRYRRKGDSVAPASYSNVNAPHNRMNANASVCVHRQKGILK